MLLGGGGVLKKDTSMYAATLIVISNITIFQPKRLPHAVNTEYRISRHSICPSGEWVMNQTLHCSGSENSETGCLWAWRARRTHKGYEVERPKGVEVKKTEREGIKEGQRPHCNECKEGKRLSRDPWGRIKKKARGLKGIRANYRGRRNARERSADKWEKQRVGRLQREGEDNSSWQSHRRRPWLMIDWFFN